MNLKKTVTYILICVFLSGLVLSYFLYDWSFAPNTISFEKEGYLYIPTGSNFKDVVDILDQNKFIKNKKSFAWLAKQKQYKEAANFIHKGLNLNPNHQELIYNKNLLFSFTEHEK